MKAVKATSAAERPVCDSVIVAVVEWVLAAGRRVFGGGKAVFDGGFR